MSHLQGWIINFSSNSGKSLVPATALSLIFYSTGLRRCPVLSYYYNHITYYSRVHGRKSPWRIPLYISLKCNPLPNQNQSTENTAAHDWPEQNFSSALFELPVDICCSHCFKTMLQPSTTLIIQVWHSFYMAYPCFVEPILPNLGLT